MRSIKHHVQERNGAWYVDESLVPLYNVIAMWQQGFSPEEIQVSFPMLSLRQLYGAILHYLEHQDELEAFFRAQDILFVQRKGEAEARNPAFYADMRERIAQYRAAKRKTASAVPS